MGLSNHIMLRADAHNVCYEVAANRYVALRALYRHHRAFSSTRSRQLDATYSVAQALQPTGEMMHHTVAWALLASTVIVLYVMLLGLALGVLDLG